MSPWLCLLNMPSPMPKFIPFQAQNLSAEESLKKALELEALMEKRRSIRLFSERPVAKELVQSLVRTASSAPSGAHKQPWTFCIISDPKIKQQIRQAAEKEEYESYSNRMSEEWLAALKPFGTNWEKPFLERAPYLIVIFKKSYDILPDGSRSKNYYVNESVGLAAGFLISAIHQAGLVTLTHTPSPMNFLQEILQRPKNEKPFLLLPIGYAAAGCEVPDLRRKSLDEVALYWEAD